MARPQQANENLTAAIQPFAVRFSDKPSTHGAEPELVLPYPAFLMNIALNLYLNPALQKMKKYIILLSNYVIILF